jgi:hypothetical protein
MTRQTLHRRSADRLGLVSSQDSRRADDGPNHPSVIVPLTDEYTQSR